MSCISSTSAVNENWIAIEADSAFIVIPLNHTGRIDFQRCKVIGHAGQIFDLKFNPFNEHQIASASDDCTIKLWDIPEGGLASSLSDFKVELRGHRRKITQLEWHPSTENVLFSSAFDNLVIVWDVSTSPLNGSNVLKVIDCHVDQIYSLAVNREGSLIATTSKDKILRVIEPRTGIVVAQGVAHSSSKQSKVVFLDDGKVLTTGFSKHSDRQYAIWNQHDLNKSLAAADIDSASGILQPFYDFDTKTLFLCGKGEGTIRYYETSNEAPYIWYLNQFISGQPQKALGCMPKRALDVSACEIFRFYKLISGNLVEPVSFVVPRKSTLFQADLYPDTLSTTPAMTIRDWFVLGMNVKPNLVSLHKGEPTAFEFVMRKSINSAQNTLTRKADQEKKNQVEVVDTKVKTAVENSISKKFAFLAEQTQIDYRPNKNEKTNTNQSTKFHQLQSIFGQQNSQVATKELINGLLPKTLEENISLVHAENEVKFGINIFT